MNIKENYTEEYNILFAKFYIKISFILFIYIELH